MVYVVLDYLSAIRQKLSFTDVAYVDDVNTVDTYPSPHEYLRSLTTIVRQCIHQYLRVKYMISTDI